MSWCRVGRSGQIACQDGPIPSVLGAASFRWIADFLVMEIQQSHQALELTTGFESSSLLPQHMLRRNVSEIISAQRSTRTRALIRSSGSAPTNKPFDVLAEGLVSEKYQDNKTAIELFLAGVQGLEAGVRRKLEDGKLKTSVGRSVESERRCVSNATRPNPPILCRAACSSSPFRPSYPSTSPHHDRPAKRT
jgi:hypothetical protein